MEGLEGKLMNCMHDYVYGMEQKLKKIYGLSEELGFGRIVARVGSRSCDLLEYYIKKSWPGNLDRLHYVNFNLREEWPLPWFPLEEILKMASPFSERVDDDGYFIDRDSKDLVVKSNLQSLAFGIYEETYRKRQQGWHVVLRGGGNVKDILDVDRFFKL